MLWSIILVSVVAAILILTELLWRKKALKGEWLRKSVHLAIATFVAFWPWLISWGWIELIGLAFLLGVLINRRFKMFNMLAGLRRGGLGDVYFALAIIACALLTDVKIFFALAILHLALADSAAALSGQHWGKVWQYKIFGQTKSLVGSMIFWAISLMIIGAGGLFAYDYLSYNSYILALFVLPPTLTALENFSVYGLDNLTVPVAVVIALQLIS